MAIYPREENKFLEVTLRSGRKGIFPEDLIAAQLSPRC